MSLAKVETDGLARGRDAQRTREAVLNAAERLFAERGYEATSLQDIGHQAGVSRGTPGYFFGSKEQLYQAVLERVLEAARVALLETRERMVERGFTVAEILAEVVDRYLELLVSRPTFVRLMQWEALTGGRFLGSFPPHLAISHEGLVAVDEDLRRGMISTVDPQQLMLSILGMCWFPVEQADTLRTALGVDPRDPSFLEARKRHVVDLILNGVLPRKATHDRC